MDKHEIAKELAGKLRELADKFDAGEIIPDGWQMNLGTGQRDNFMSGCVEHNHSGGYDLIIKWEDPEQAAAFIEWTQEGQLLNLEQFIESKKRAANTT